jgi:hypothetical protein
MEKTEKSENRAYGHLGGIRKASPVLNPLGPKPASTNPPPSQPGLSPSGQVCGQIGSADRLCRRRTLGLI